MHMGNLSSMGVLDTPALLQSRHSCQSKIRVSSMQRVKLEKNIIHVDDMYNLADKVVLSEPACMHSS